MDKSKKIWQVNKFQNEEVERVMEDTVTSRLLAAVLASRGWTDPEALRSFLYPQISNLHSPLLLKDMQKAVDRICREIDRGGRIIVYGDYDVDGVTSTSILYDFLRGLNARVEYYIPDRFEEGYGLNINTAEALCDCNPSLIITVDNGISAVEEIKYINSRGIDVIVTDHHECKDILPPAYAVINPKRPDCTYPFKFLAGVGVVFKLVQALSTAVEGQDSQAFRYLDLVCIGTIADIVPLTDENRILVKYGLEALAQTCNPGLKALCHAAGVEDINTWTVGYMLSPRLNAAGRLGDAGRAVELLTAGDDKDVFKIAEELDRENRNRQDIEAQLLEQVTEKIEAEGLDKDNILVIDGENWHHGVIGIAASRITERYNKPCILIAFEGDIGKGSGRSVEGFNLFGALTSCSQLLDKFGGHELAGGLTIRREYLAEFRNQINGMAELAKSRSHMTDIIRIDARATCSLLTLESVSELKLLEPHGSGNPRPLFCMEKLRTSSMKAVGGGRHLKLVLDEGGTKVDAIGFGMGEMIDELERLDLIDVICTPEINRYAGRTTVQLNLKGIRPNIETELESMYYRTFIFKREQKNWDTRMDNLKFEFLDRDSDSIIGLANSGAKNIFLINTLQACKDVLNCMEDNRIKLLGSFGVFFNTVDAGNSFEDMPNVIVINPLVDRINFSGCENVILCDAFFNLSYYDTIRRNCSDRRIFIMSSDEDLRYNLETLDSLIPQRHHLAAVYKSLQNHSIMHVVKFDRELLSKQVTRTFNIQVNPVILDNCLDIFHELRLIDKSFEGEKLKVEMLPSNGEKAELSRSGILSGLLEYREEYQNTLEILKRNNIRKD